MPILNALLFRGGKTMQWMKRCLVVGVALFVYGVSTGVAQVDSLADVILQAYQNNRPFPLLSAQHPEMDVTLAYAIQKAYVNKLLANDKIAGFKAGLTSQAGQQKFGVDAPVAGVLLQSGKLADGATVDKTRFVALMLETEIGYVLGRRITQPLNDVAELQAAVKSVLPVVELPDLGFTDMQRLKGVDIIAANVCAKQVIVGPERPATGVDVNAVTVTLTRDGQAINQGKGTEALGDQWQAALWLINTMIKQGWTVEPGYVFITGALGNMLPGKPGRYVADYGEFGKITFVIR
jgi:2-keto-4-pentenoate hydratase